MLDKAFSIIMPTYNCAEKIERSLESALSQQEGLYELIVVDGASTDGTVEQLHGYGNKVRWISEPDGGIYDGMNKGIGLARGRYLYFLGAGDTLRPGVLATVASRLPDQPLTLAYGKVYLQGSRQVQGEPFTRLMLRNGNIPHQACFYERTLFDVFGLYDLSHPLWADYVLNMRCFSDPRVHTLYLDEMIADYEGGGASVVSPNLRREQRALPGLIRRHLGLKAYLLFQVQRLVPMRWRKARVKRRDAERPARKAA